VATSDVTGKNITLPTAVHISGKVTNAGSTGLAGIEVDACLTTASCTYAGTASDGTYSVAVAPTTAIRSISATTPGATRAATTRARDRQLHRRLELGYGRRCDHKRCHRQEHHPAHPGPHQRQGDQRRLHRLAAISFWACPASSGFCTAAGTAGDGTYSVAVAPTTATRSILRQLRDLFQRLLRQPREWQFTVDWNSASAIAVATSDVTGKNITLPPSGATYHAMIPVRILDSRYARASAAP